MSDPQDTQSILRALALPDDAVPLFLEHIAQFCHAHGGERHYAQLLALVSRCQDSLGGQ